MLLTLLRKTFRKQDPERFTAEGLAYYQRGELEAAECSFLEAARSAPLDVDAWNNLVAVMMRQKKHRAALPIVAHLAELVPERASVHLDLGTCYNRIGRHAEAIRAYEKALALQPDYHMAHAHIANPYMDACEWGAVERWRAAFHEFRARVAPEIWIQRINPFNALTLTPGKLAKEIACRTAGGMAQAVRPSEHWAAAPRAHGSKIRVAYVSGDFNNHAASHLTYGLYENHDRRQFEVYAYSTGPDDAGSQRKHIERSCDRFYDVREETEERTAARIRADAIDILVDMNGHAERNRMRIFAHRPAPVQVNYLGFPGTSGADFIDYFISDPIASPPGSEEEFTERLVRLPGTYQVTYADHPVARDVTRAQCGLPEGAFVYCDFNAARKIERRIFEVWMSVLRRTPSSVLWLLSPGELGETNLRKHARVCGVDPARIVFADQVPNPVYRARLQLADLWLDTLTYNAHTGASDALGAGLPVLTCPGHTFAGRVAASILHAAQMDDLAASDLEAYENLAVELAQKPQRLSALKHRLAQNRSTCALFDTPRYVRGLEAAYVRMHEMRLRGEAPADLTIPG